MIFYLCLYITATFTILKLSGFPKNKINRICCSLKTKNKTDLTK